jgi:hypothetical protein
MIILREKNRVQESLVLATSAEFDKLKAQIEQSPSLRKQLSVPMSQAPHDQYRYIYGGIPNAEIYSLLSLLNFLIAEGKANLLFSKAGNEFTGFVAFVESGRRIYGVKIASFYNDNLKANRTLAGDLREFIIWGLKNHDAIEWEAERDNSANEMYQKAIPRWFPLNPFSFHWDERKRRFIYEISRHK